MPTPDFDRLAVHPLDLSLRLPCHFSHTPSLNAMPAPRKRASRFSLKRMFTFIRRRPSPSQTVARSFIDFDVYPELEPPSPTSSTSSSSSSPFAPYLNINTAYSIYSDYSTYDSYTSTSAECEDPFAKEGIQILGTREKPLPCLPIDYTPLPTPPTSPLPERPTAVDGYAPSAWLKSPLKSKHHYRTSDISFLFPPPPSSTSSLYTRRQSLPLSDEEGDWLDLLPSDSECEDNDTSSQDGFYTARSSFS